MGEGKELSRFFVYVVIIEDASTSPIIGAVYTDRDKATAEVKRLRNASGPFNTVYYIMRWVE